ncbi:protein phosphatase [Allocatelliglobosispora scoriae]|uniref:Protein phosphatase n=1 Tax=Allocatelliglobosispora scoriae TaxID=643052 RepID=A0A841BS14_9ACTN|nr:protein phosphatase 2C domain-containing protein [Allocatelliglobosispora scoriae]MBB5869601.1 protein phosphatase [Allocatelliglobosispora scoriae]
MSLILHSVAVTDPGLIRPNNEDSAHAGPHLIAVADGIGGQPSGEVASQIVIAALAKVETMVNNEDPLTLMRAAIDAANQRIRQVAETDRATDGMGTTVSALFLREERLAILHVGDSRAYRLRDEKLEQLTRDDTYVQSLVDQGLLPREEARHHPQRSLITQAVQGGHFEPTVAIIDVRVGDRFLICSDGLSDIVTDQAITEVLAAHPRLRLCADRLIKLALQAGAPDNVTVVVADAVTA